MKTETVLDHPADRACVEVRRSLPQWTLDVIAGFNGEPFTVTDFVCAAQADGVTDHRDMSAMLHHALAIIFATQRGVS
jgi:hypothetical protein